MAADTDAARDHLRLALDLHNALATADTNSCFSPYSVASTLGLVARGARGNTASELSGLLTSVPDGLDAQARLLSDAARLRAPQGQQEPQLAVSNTLWAWDGLPIQRRFRAELATWPSGAIAAAPFRDAPESARRTINADVSERTNGLIPELLPSGAVDPDTVASLVNALYLRVGWVFPFQADATIDGDFRGVAGITPVPMMEQTEELGYVSRAGWQAVALPAVGGTQAVVLLPDGDLAEQERDLDAVLLANLLEETAGHRVRLRLPRFRLDVREPLTTVLRDLGVRELFTPRADLGGISDDDRLYVDSVLHQAVLRVDENGLEGAAATAAMMRLVSMPVGEPVTVHVDRPFLLLVRHPDTGAVYFFARVARP